MDSRKYLGHRPGHRISCHERTETFGLDNDVTAQRVRQLHASSSSMAHSKGQGSQDKQTNQMEELEDASCADQNGVALGGVSVVERGGKKRKKERLKGNENPLLQDPLEVLGRDITMRILSNLDARSVALSLLVSRNWYSVASTDRLWSSKCEELWLGKAHIPRLSQMRGISKLAAYSLSFLDGQRTRIMKDDLCDHVWEFHFTQAAPEYWRNLDPYWQGTSPLMHRYFHPDGSQTADPGDQVWGGHECCYSTVTSFIGERTIREHYVRINRWPQLSVHRKQDWSWEMSNHLYHYSSVPDASKEGGTGPLFLVVYDKRILTDPCRKESLIC